MSCVGVGGECSRGRRKVLEVESECGGRDPISDSESDRQLVIPFPGSIFHVLSISMPISPQ